MAPSTESRLASLALSQGTITPGFSSGTSNYTATVANNVASLTVTPTALDGNATVRVNGIVVPSGTASGSIPLAVRDNVITLVVTAQDGVTTTNYQVTVTRQAAFATVPVDTPRNPGASLSVTPQLTGSVIYSSTETFVGTLDCDLAGTLRTLVVDRGGGLLDFYYQLTNSSAEPAFSGSDIFRFAVGGYGDSSTQVAATYTPGIADVTGAPAGFYTSTPTAGNAVQSADRDGSLSNADGVSLKTRCFRGESIEVPAYLGPTYTAQGAQSGPCPPDLAPPLLSIAPPPPEPFTLGGAGFTFDPAGNAGPGSAPFNINYDDPPSSAPANIEAGETSNWLVVRTNRTAFGRVIAHVSAGDGTAVVATLGPLGTAVPGDRNPIANPETLERYPAQSIKVLVTTLLANDTDPDGDTPLSLTAVSVAASGQATVSLSGAYVFYQPAAGFTGSDSFTYALSDGHGGSATGTVTVNIKPDTGASQNVTNIEMLGDGSVRTSFAGIPNRTYRIQSTESLTPLAVWTTRASFTANAVGEFQFTDPPVLPPQRFYRSIYP